MKIPHPTTVDFETFGIEGRPDYPPVPVGVAIKPWGKSSRYYAWGHPTGNNSTKEKAVEALRVAYNCKDGILCHHGKFDLDVAEVHLRLAIPAWNKVEETMFLGFLDNPHRRELGLKPLAKDLLGWEPEERDVVADWLVEHQPVPGVKISRSTSGKNPFGKYIAYAPGDVVGPYACGDTDRTAAIFEHLYQSVAERGMLPAYDRERRLVPILLDMERRGIRVDLSRLRADVESYTHIVNRIDAWVRKRLKIVDVDFNPDSGAQLVRALEDAGLIDTSVMGVTKTGLVKTDKASLAAGVTDKVLAAVLKYDTQLKTCLRTFMQPWLATAEHSGDLIFTNWHQTRGGDGGTRTGRLSSSPNFQNIPTEFDDIFGDGRKLPKCPWKDLPPLPQCRSYIIAHKGQALCGRDFASQELRVLAHFEDGAMLQGYLDQPDIDFHQHAADLVTKVTGIVVTRKKAKTIGFAILYGAGVGKMALQLGCTVEDARRMLDAYFSVFPGIRTIQKDMKFRARMNQPIRTTGGREYFCEPPKFIDGRFKTFDFKLVNYLVQGSASDQTKDAMIRFDEAAGPGKLILSVHDEIVTSVPPKDKTRYMMLLRDAMNYKTLDVPMLSDGEWGASWASMEKSSV